MLITWSTWQLPEATWTGFDRPLPRNDMWCWVWAVQVSEIRRGGINRLLLVRNCSRWLTLQTDLAH